MGCCISSNNKTKSPHLKKSPDSLRFLSEHPQSAKTHINNRAPPPCFEEETVKEVVLSETRFSKPHSPTPKQTEVEADTHPISVPIIEEHNIEAKDLVLINKHEEELEISQASQVSEIYSITESFSTTTTTTTTTIAEKREDEVISKPTTRRSPAKVPRKRPYAGEVSRGAKSPAKRAEVSRSAQGRTMPRNVGSTGLRRENGEAGSSVRRSRSPATRTVGRAGRSPGGKAVGRVGGRLRVENEVKKEVNDGVLEKRTVESSESLDNPHVSLECFIFL